MTTEEAIKIIKNNINCYDYATEECYECRDSCEGCSYNADRRDLYFAHHKILDELKNLENELNIKDRIIDRILSYVEDRNET